MQNIIGVSDINGNFRIFFVPQEHMRSDPRNVSLTRVVIISRNFNFYCLLLCSLACLSPVITLKTIWIRDIQLYLKLLKLKLLFMWIELLFAIFPLWQPGFDFRLCHVRFLFDRVALVRVFYEYANSHSIRYSMFTKHPVIRVYTIFVLVLGPMQPPL